MQSSDYSSEVRLVTDDYGNLVECRVRESTDDFGIEVGPEWMAMRNERPGSSARTK